MTGQAEQRELLLAVLRDQTRPHRDEVRTDREVREGECHTHTCVVAAGV